MIEIESKMEGWLDITMKGLFGGFDTANQRYGGRWRGYEEVGNSLAYTRFSIWIYGLKTSMKYNGEELRMNESGTFIFLKLVSPYHLQSRSTYSRSVGVKATIGTSEKTRRKRYQS